jgi:hypothetical protein
MKKKCLAVGIILLFAGTGIAAMEEPSAVLLTKTKATLGPYDSSRNQIELKYYDPITLSQVLGVNDGPYVIWKEAIRLTHTELAPYKNWNITKVVIGFGEDPEEGSMNVTIIIYDNGTSTHPGNVIVNDTWAILNGTRLITVPLKTPVSLSPVDRDEIWVAVEWTQIVGATHYAFVDGGPAVVGKGDWVYLNDDTWQELRNGGGIPIDANWALGAIIEIQNQTSIALESIRGPLGITAELYNTGDFDAYNISWSIAVNGGFFYQVNKRTTGSQHTLHAKESMAISLPPFFGVGVITIQINVFATNVGPVSASKSAYIIGPLVLRIR